MGLCNKIGKINAMVCPWWLCRCFDNPLRRLLHDPERLLGPYVTPGMTAVDVGCGMGYFSVGLAKLVGPGGRVVAVDLQERMLSGVERRASRAGLDDRIVRRLVKKESLGVKGPVDFVLIFWMAHEVPDKPRFFGEIFSLLKTGGRILLVEPKVHVTQKNLAKTLAACRDAGFRVLDEPGVALSRAFLLEK
jgi:ubiquinone/menaquinone biosynthesis C-methylase UbiE